MRLIHLLILIVSMALLTGCPSGEGGDAAAPAEGTEAPKADEKKADDKKADDKKAEAKPAAAPAAAPAAKPAAAPAGEKKAE